MIKLYYDDKKVRNNILSNPFKRFEDMNMMNHSKTIGIIQVDALVWEKLSDSDREQIEKTCDKKLDEYYDRLKKSIIF